MQNTITLDQAKQRANAYIQQVGTVLPSKPRLVPIAGGIGTLECTDPDDNGPQGRISAAADYFLEDIPTERNPEIFDFFRRHLIQQGFKVNIQQSDFLVMVNPKDGFRIGLKESGDGSKGLSLAVSSPCVWPNGTPDHGVGGGI